MRLEKRPAVSPLALLAASVGAVVFTLLVSSLLVLWAGAPVAPTWGHLLRGGFGSVFAWTETLTRATPLILTGLAAAVAFKARLFNIGAEGQLYAGALAAGELVRVAAAIGRIEADPVEHLGDIGVLLRLRHQPVHDRRLADDVGDAQARIERGHRVLEDHLDGERCRLALLRRHLVGIAPAPE